MKVKLHSYAAGGYGIGLYPENEAEETMLKAAVDAEAVITHSALDNPENSLLGSFALDNEALKKANP